MKLIQEGRNRGEGGKILKTKNKIKECIAWKRENKREEKREERRESVENIEWLRFGDCGRYREIK